MARQRQTSSTPSTGSRSRGVVPAARQRPKDGTARDVPLTEEELRNLAVEEDLDPEDVARLLRSGHENNEASDHDRDTPRDDLESLTLDERE